MKVDWKKVAQSPGYRSLKAAYCSMAMRWNRDKDREYKAFRKIIDMAKSHAEHRGVALEEVLNEWEAKRIETKGHNFSSYYHNFTKVHSNAKKPWGLKAALKNARKSAWGYNARERHARRRAAVIRVLNSFSKTTTKSRWPMDRRKRMRRYRERVNG